jgi:very-short-patch-repair endonuclease
MIAQHGYTVLRFWDDEVLKNPEGVIEAIAREVTRRKLAPSPSPLPR